MIKTTKTGFDAFGKIVPFDRMQKAYEHLQEILGPTKKELAYSITVKCAQAIAKDQPFRIVGAVSGIDKDIDKIDLTARYRILAVLLTN